MFKQFRALALSASALVVAIGVPATANAVSPDTSPGNLRIQSAQPVVPLTSDSVAATKGYMQLAKKERRVRNRRWRNRRGRHSRRHRRHRRRHHDRHDFRPGAAIGGLIGGILLNEAFRDSRGSDLRRCDNRYRSFRWSDGTFQPYGDGPRRLCPYLY